MESQFEINQRVNHYWCGDGTVTDIFSDDGALYYQIEWDSGLVNENIEGYSDTTLRSIA